MLAYDFFLSLEAERQFLWRRKLSVVSCIFAINRATAAVVVIEDILLFHGKPVSRDPTMMSYGTDICTVAIVGHA